jgi:2-oxo-4-hydroxy-4-carboxy-5-ureidoimidazoline decarboxylase
MDLETLNNISLAEAESLFRDCCGSSVWAREMAKARPFPTVSALLDQAEKIWWNIEAQDWLEAFSVHPEIGDRKAAPKQARRSAGWSEGEQAGMNEATAAVREELAEANRLYQEKFGYIFIVCATGKSAEEMLEICRGRLMNEADEELPVAAEEQRKITEIRLRKLLNG